MDIYFVGRDSQLECVEASRVASPWLTPPGSKDSKGN